MARKSRGVTILTIVLVLSGSRVGAWERDVHYLLTFWLALQAGFSRPDALRIAEGNQSYDDSAHAGAIPTVLLIAATGDPGAARSVRDKHFPSHGELPSPPELRVVTPKSDSARRAVKAVLEDTRPDLNVFDLGEALHPFQDSWSHQGVPSVPFGIRPNLSFAHPEKRGGWWSHDADYAHLHVDEVVEVADETYKILLAYLAERPSSRHRQAANWRDLRGAVRELAESKTRTQRNDWAVKYLSESAAVPPRVVAHALPLDLRSTLGLTSTPSESPSALVDAAREFLTSWLGKQDIDRAVQFVDVPALREQFVNVKQLSTHEQVAEWLDKTLTLQLVADHEVVNNAGHGNPSVPGYADLPRRPQREGPYEVTTEIPKLTVESEDLFPAPAFGGGQYALLLTAQTSVRDGIALIWRQSSDGWRIVRLMVTPE